MRATRLNVIAAAALCLVASGTALNAQKRKNAEPKSQVQPLPPEPPMALAVDTDSIDFHISRLLTTGGLAAQIRESLNDLIRNTRGETIVKLRAFVSGSGDTRRVQALVTELFSEHRLPLPAISILQVGALGQQSAKVVIEAVVSTHRNVNPNGLAFFFGQHGTSLPNALQTLKQDTHAAGIPGDRILSCTCFTSRIDNFEADTSAARTLFPKTALNVVQAVRDPLSDASMCEAVGQPPNPPARGPVIRLESASATLVNSPQLIFTGMQLSFGNYLDDAREAFARLQHAAAAVRPVQTPVEVDAFTLDASAGSALHKTNLLAPRTLTVQPVEGLPAIDALAGIEGIFAPNVESAVTVEEKPSQGYNSP
ncbi:MAG: RidA family protein [Acidobacteriaceae bacterium]|nr:RidA family protein [Acidobacteriaceae bacterium]